MKSQRASSFSLLVVSLGLLVGPLSVWAQGGGGTPSAFGVSKESVFRACFCLMTVGLVFAFAFVAIGLLRSRDWQLGDAIS
jgi:hypothetical protein